MGYLFLGSIGLRSYWHCFWYGIDSDFGIGIGIGIGIGVNLYL